MSVVLEHATVSFIQEKGDKLQNEIMDSLNKKLTSLDDETRICIESEISNLIFNIIKEPLNYLENNDTGHDFALKLFNRSKEVV